MKTYEKIPLRPYKTKELWPHYCDSLRQFQRELKKLAHKLGEKDGHTWKIPQVQIIFAEMGWPEIEIKVDHAA